METKTTRACKVNFGRTIQFAEAEVSTPQRVLPIITKTGQQQDSALITAQGASTHAYSTETNLYYSITITVLPVPEPVQPTMPSNETALRI